MIQYLILTHYQVFLPLQIDPYLISLAKTPKAIRAPSPSVGDGTISNANLGPHTIDIRKLALTAFRDSVVHPIAPRLHVRLTSPRREPTPELTEHQAPRLEQMYEHNFYRFVYNSHSPLFQALSPLFDSYQYYISNN